MQSLFLQVTPQQLVFFWHQLFPILHVCSHAVLLIAKGVGIIAAGQKLYTWCKRPESLPGFCKLQTAWQRICALWLNLINFMRKYLRK
jgi:hypothetical protein